MHSRQGRYHPQGSENRFIKVKNFIDIIMTCDPPKATVYKHIQCIWGIRLSLGGRAN